jgi:hypothetical protein
VAEWTPLNTSESPVSLALMIALVLKIRRVLMVTLVLIVLDPELSPLAAPLLSACGPWHKEKAGQTPPVAAPRHRFSALHLSFHPANILVLNKAYRSRNKEEGLTKQT